MNQKGFLLCAMFIGIILVFSSMFVQVQVNTGIEPPRLMEWAYGMNKIGIVFLFIALLTAVVMIFKKNQ